MPSDPLPESVATNDLLLAAAARLALRLGEYDPEFTAWRGVDPGAAWTAWGNVVIILTPEGQMAFHIHRNAMDTFRWLPDAAELPDMETYRFDGHDEAELRARLRRFIQDDR